MTNECMTSSVYMHACTAHAHKPVYFLFVFFYEPVYMHACMFTTLEWNGNQVESDSVTKCLSTYMLSMFVP